MNEELERIKAQRDEWIAIANKEAANCNELERENDELLAALKVGAEGNGLFKSACVEAIANARRESYEEYRIKFPEAPEGKP